MIARHLGLRLVQALGRAPVVLLQGARQTGKSTLARALTAGQHPARYLTFDDAALLSAAQHDPAGFLSRFEGPLVLDEVQKAPELFVAIKLNVDRRRTAGRFLLTGSANVLSLPRLSDSLAGRMEIHTLWPLSQGEIEGRREGFIDAVFAENFKLPASRAARADLPDRLLRGGYPEIARSDSQERRSAWFSSYVTTMLHRDVRDLAGIEGLSELPRLLSLLATRAGSLLNFADIARGLSMPQTTLKRYFALLEATFLVQPLPAWFANLGQRLVKSPKLYLNDSGLLAHLQGADRERWSADPLLSGPILENFVVMELRKQATWSRIRPELFHFRTPAGREVDIVLEARGGRLVGIEVKAGATLSSADFKNLRILQELTGRRFRRGVVFYTGSEPIPFGHDLFALPIENLWAIAEQA
ncbi:MAG TPA: ATP-binding protein [Phycisphaerae bacterium]|jgi:hypothetical protein